MSEKYPSLTKEYVDAVTKLADGKVDRLLITQDFPSKSKH